MDASVQIKTEKRISADGRWEYSMEGDTSQYGCIDTCTYTHGVDREMGKRNESIICPSDDDAKTVCVGGVKIVGCNSTYVRRISEKLINKSNDDNDSEGG